MPWLVIASSYLLGSLPTAYLAGRLKGKDIRRLGDGNVGAANAYRELGAKTGAIVFLLDAAKGALAIFIAERLQAHQMVVLLSGAAAVGGHNWPVFLGFRGGRGESTTIGVLLSLITQPMLICAVPALVTLIISRNVTRASAALFVPLPLVGWWLAVPGVLITYSIILPVLVGITHYFRTHPHTPGDDIKALSPPAYSGIDSTRPQE
ncbi:MAG: glycerol-3-phosphate acyltransferase [Chloroflexota bacterium]